MLQNAMAILILCLSCASAQDRGDARLARELFAMRHLEAFNEWHRIGAASREFSWEEGRGWFLLRLEDTDGSCVVEYPFRLSYEYGDCDHYQGDGELTVIRRVREIYYLRVLAAVERERLINEDKRPTPEPASFEILDAVRDGKTHLYILPTGRHFDRTLLTRRLRVF